MSNMTTDIVNNPLVKWAIIAGVLAILVGIGFFAGVSAGLQDAIDLIADIFPLIAILYVFGPWGPLGKGGRGG